MRGEVIALDLETTGLDANYDEIIEIGIALCKDGDILDSYQQLVKPSIEIPHGVVALTGITNQDVADAPNIDDVIRNVEDFIGDRPIVGHNIEFDIGFLKQNGIGYHNQPIDTYELAAVLIPTSPRYSLSALADLLELTLENAHRAYDDALAGWYLYRKLWEKLFEVDLDILQEIIHLSEGVEWSAAIPMQDALDMRLEKGEQLSQPVDFTDHFPIRNDTQSRRLIPNETLQEIDVDAIASIIDTGGLLSQKMADFEPRESQVEMLKMVGRSFNDSEHLMIEAPTGTGKSLAYLLPAIEWAKRNNERVVVSTHTITLQDQLLDKDIPFIQDELGISFKAAALKGRANYLCPRRFEFARHHLPNNIEDLRVRAKTLIWLSQGGTGIRTELNLRSNTERTAWTRISAQDDDCTGETCLWKMGGICPFYQARKTAETAHILIVNHALLLSDVATGSLVLPHYKYLVMDEAHHLEDAITRSLSTRIDKFSLMRRISDMGGLQKGILGELLEALDGSVPPNDYAKVHDWIANMDVATQQMGKYIHAFFDELPRVLIDFADDFGQSSSLSVRITGQTRRFDQWSRIEQRWGRLEEFTAVLSNAMSVIRDKMIKRFSQYKDGIPYFDSIASSVRAIADYLETVHATLEAFVKKPDANTIYWVDIRGIEHDFVYVNSAPLHVGSLVEEHLWNEKEAIVLASATLQTHQGFDYIDDRLNAFGVKHSSVATPFDYENSAMLYIPDDVPEPKERDQYQSMLEEGIIELAKVTQGRMLCLFTSYTHLTETTRAVGPVLEAEGISIYDQASGSSRQVILDSFRDNEKSVLMGTRSFWEGVDLPGDDLVAVVIARLPFSVPSEPVFAARSDSYGDRSFLDYSVPDAILRFRQGFGRLIRRQTDRGIVVIFDRRISSKRYGKHFLDALPDVTVRRNRLAALPRIAEKWLNEDDS